MVVTTASKDKQYYDNMEARVIKVLSQKVRVCLLTGPKSYTEKDFAKCNVRKKSPEPSSGFAAKKPPSQDEVKAEAEAAAKDEKRMEAVAKAKELFPDVDMQEE